MAEQVNPLGGLASGMGQALQVLQALPAPSSSKSPPVSSAESKTRSLSALAEDRQDADVSDDSLDEVARLTHVTNRRAQAKGNATTNSTFQK